jgi:hypothetical protein
LHQDGGGRQLCSKWNLDVLLDGTKDNLSWDEDGWQL